MEKKIQTIIIEDEKEDLDLIVNLLKPYEIIHVSATVNDVENGIAIITHHKPELIFLDIKLYGRTSFDILDTIYKLSIKPKVIFTTAFDDYMSKAFKYAAFDYLLKPIDRNELQNTITRYIENKEQGDFNISYQKFKYTEKKLIFNTVEGFEIVDPKRVVYLTTVNNQGYTEFFMNNGSVITVTKGIGEIEKLLTQDWFFKIHRSYILNLNYVNKVNRIKGKCIMKTNIKSFEIPISRDKAKILKDIIIQFNSTV